jgi:hypothetical protein
LLFFPERHLRLIEEWKREDIVFYERTRAFEAAWNMVNSNTYITLIGGPASGKSATARHIALKLESDNFEVVTVCKLEEILLYGNFDRKQVFVLDDVLGIYSVDMTIYNSIASHMTSIFKAIGEESKLLFTSRKTVYVEAKRIKSFVTENVVDLQSVDNELNESEKINILTEHCKFTNVDLKLNEKMSFASARIMFPFLCKWFSSDIKYQRLGTRFFNKPHECLIEEVDKLQLTNTIQYAALALCLVNNNNVSDENLSLKQLKSDIYDWNKSRYMR